MLFEFFNDTGRLVRLHGATFANGCTGDREPIKPLEIRSLLLPPGTYPWVKLWDHGEDGLMLAVFPRSVQSEGA